MKKSLIICALFLYTSSAMAILGLSRIIPTELKESDIQLMMQNARANMDGKDVGTVLTWQNAETRNRGQVRLLRSFKMRGNECREVHHTVDLHREKEGFAYTSTICKDNNGEWIILP